MINNLPLTNIVLSDQELLKRTVQAMKPNSDHYEDSWGYIIQATRYGGFKLYDPTNGFLIFFGRKSEVDQTIVVPNFFATPKYLTDIVNKIQINRHNSKTILKNIKSEEINDFLALGFRKYYDNEKWSEEAKFDDQTFPQLIIELEKVKEAKGTKYHHLKKVLNKNLNLDFRPYRNSDKEDVLELFAIKDNHTTYNPMRKYGMYFDSHAMYPDANIDRFVITDISNKILGFTATSDISTEITAFVAGIFRNEVKEASTWGIYQTLIKKYYEGYRYTNLGGCETQETSNFLKGKFRPIKEIQKTHLVYDP